MSTTVVPTMDSMGWVQDVPNKLDRLLSYFYYSDYKQSDLYAGQIQSLPRFLQTVGNKATMAAPKIEEALQRLEEQEADPMAEPLTADQLYWWGIWTIQMPDAKRRGMTSVPTCAKEAAVLGLYEKSKKGGKKK